MGAMDLLKSERGVLNLVFLTVLAVLLFTRAPKEMIDTWAMYAGGSVGLYTVAKSLKPNDAPGPVAPVAPASDSTMTVAVTATSDTTASSR